MARVLALLAGATLLTAAAPPPQPYRSLTADFAALADATEGLPLDERVAQVRARFGRLFPAFYRPRDGRGPAEYDRMIARSLLAFRHERAALDETERAFAAAYIAELFRFRAIFPTFRQTSPVYLLHSLGEMDAGTRVIGGRRVLIFGVDGIARYDRPDAIPMLIDHEFFHILHGRSFPGCYAVWCTVWREGLAVYATSILNPRANDRQLGLEEPGRLRPAVEAHRRDALCLLQAKLTATDRASNRLFFLSGGGQGPLPSRFGYYLGYRIAQRAGQTRPLAGLGRLPMSPARRLVTETLAAMIAEEGGCVADQPATVSTISPGTVHAVIGDPSDISARSL